MDEDRRGGQNLPIYWGICRKLAEGVGFEPTDGLPHRLISSQVPSTTQPPFLWESRRNVALPDDCKQPNFAGIQVHSKLICAAKTLQSAPAYLVRVGHKGHSGWP